MTDPVRASILGLNCLLYRQGACYRAYTLYRSPPPNFPFAAECIGKGEWTFMLPVDSGEIIIYSDEPIPRSWRGDEQLQWNAEYEGCAVIIWALLQRSLSFAASVVGVDLPTPLLVDQRHVGYQLYEGYIPLSGDIHWDIPAIIGTYKGYFVKELLVGQPTNHVNVTLQSGHRDVEIPEGILRDQNYVDYGTHVDRSCIYGTVRFDDPDLRVTYRARRHGEDDAWLTPNPALQWNADRRPFHDQRQRP